MLLSEEKQNPWPDRMLLWKRSRRDI